MKIKKQFEMKTQYSTLAIMAAGRTIQILFFLFSAIFIWKIFFEVPPPGDTPNWYNKSGWNLEQVVFNMLQDTPSYETIDNDDGQ